MEMPPPPLEDKVWKGVIKPTADVLELPVEDKDLAIHVRTVFRYGRHAISEVDDHQC
jgi:hypothetical protein